MIATRTRRVFPQARARATYQALLDATRAVFSARGYDETQTPDIAAAAGVSVGTFYRYFADKRQAFIEMISSYLADAHADVMARLPAERFATLADADRRKVIDDALEALFLHVGRWPGLDRVYFAMAMRDKEVARIQREFHTLGRRALAELISALVPREVVPDPGAAAFVIHTAALGIALARASERHDDDGRAIKVAVREMFYRYLFPTGATTNGGGRNGRSGGSRTRRWRR